MIYKYGDRVPSGSVGKWINFLLSWYKHDYPSQKIDFETYAACFIFSWAAWAVGYWREVAQSQRHLDAIQPYFKYAAPVRYVPECWELLEYIATNLPSSLVENKAEEVYQGLEMFRRLDFRGFAVTPNFVIPARHRPFHETQSGEWIDRLDQKIDRAANKVLDHLRRTNPEVRDFSVDKLNNAKGNLVNELGGEFMNYVATAMHNEDFDALRKIVSRKEADDAFIERWRTGLELHYLTVLREFFKKFEAPLEDHRFDVFLCHNSKDKDEVKLIARGLQENGLSVWLDEWNLPVGRPWVWSLEEAFFQIKSVAVFIGADGIGPWQRMEATVFLDRFVKRNVPIIPVLLSAAKEPIGLPAFLSMFNWVDFRKAEPAPLERLICGIAGISPEIT